jgi:phospholipase/carboxylesterase
MDIKESSEQVVIEPAGRATACVIWLHGLGADGYDFVPLVKQLDLPKQGATRFIFPNAPMQAVTLNQGMVMPAWYDIIAIQPGAEQDAAGIEASSVRIRQLIDRQLATGIAAGNIILAGFSQGGVIAVHAGMRYPQRLAGVLALSTYLALDDRIVAEHQPCQRETPQFWAHGETDAVVPLDYAYQGYQQLLALEFAVQWHQYPMGHEVCFEEISDINRFMNQHLFKQQ